MSDDDWFERALRESDDDPGDEADETDDRPDQTDNAPDDVDDAPTATETDGTPTATGTGDVPAATEADDGEFSAPDGDGDEFPTADGADGEFATDDEWSPGPDAGDGAGGPGESRAGASPGGQTDSEESLFDDDFATAFGESGGGGFGGGGADAPFGGGEFEPGGDGGDEFSEEGFESELPRTDLGIEGLDDMVQGGVPERSLMTVIGSAGTGKTTFGLQFLRHGLSNGEKGIYITLEESRKRILDSATEKGWAFDEYAADGQLAVVDIDPVEMANSLTSIRSDLPDLVREFGAERLVLDSVSLLELMYEDRAKRRNEVYEFTRALKESGVTTLLTSEASEDNPYASRHGIVEYLTDAVFIMRYVRPSDFRETRLAIEIQKIRDANHSREMKPYEITNEGLNVYQQANIF